MAGLAQNEGGDNSRIVLELLESVERDGAQSQRKLAADLGVALGLVNVYLKRCVTKGLVKMSEAPARRYAYYLTPQGFAEKARLTLEYLTTSFSLFRQARADCAELFAAARGRGCQRFALLGMSDLAEIATICALESGTTIVAVVDAKARADHFVGIPVLNGLDDIPADTDAVVVTDLSSPQATTAAAIAKFGTERVLTPKLLGVSRGSDGGVEP